MAAFVVIVEVSQFFQKCLDLHHDYVKNSTHRISPTGLN